MCGIIFKSLPDIWHMRDKNLFSIPFCPSLSFLEHRPSHLLSSFSLMPLEFLFPQTSFFYSISFSILSALVKKSCWRKLVEVVRAAGQEARFWALGTSRATLGSVSSALPTTSQPLSLILHLLLSTTAIGKALMVTDTLLP